jgi:hypothetical protein
MVDAPDFELEPEWEPDSETTGEQERLRDPVIDEAKNELRRFFSEKPEELFYQRQLQVMFEGTYFHWITARALAELAAEGAIASAAESLPHTGSITFYRSRGHRYWRKQAKEIIG